MPEILTASDFATDTAETPAAPPTQNPTVAPAPEILRKEDFSSGIPLEETYKNNAKGDPAKAAKIIGLANQSGQPDDVVANNMADVEASLRVPSSEKFAVIQNSAPYTSKTFSDPRIMAAAHDDINNAVETESSVKKFSRDIYKEVVGSFAGFNAGITAIPELVTGSRYVGGDATKYFLDQQKAAETASPGIVQTYKSGNYSGLPGAAAHSIAQNSASLVASALSGVAVASAAGAATVGAPVVLSAAAISGLYLGFIGLQSAAQKYHQNIDSGIPQSKALANAYLTGAAETIPETLHLGAFKKMGSTLVTSFGKGTARQIAGKMIVSSVGIGASEGTEEMITATLQEPIDVMLGIRPFVGWGPFFDSIAESGITGALSGVVGGGAGVLSVASASHQQALQTQKTKDFYTGFGKTAEASKLRERLGPEYRKFVAEMTKDGPVENVLVSREALESLLQESGQDVSKAIEDLGAADSYLESLDTGEPIKIKLSEMTKLIDSGLYAKLAGDIKLRPHDLTDNERQKLVDEHLEQASKDTEAAVAAVAPQLKESADLMAGYDNALAEMTKARQAIPKPVGLTDKEYAQLIKRDATIAASMVVTRAVREKITVAESLALGPEIVAGKKVQAPESTQGLGVAAPVEVAPKGGPAFFALSPQGLVPFDNSVTAHPILVKAQIESRASHPTLNLNDRRAIVDEYFKLTKEYHDLANRAQVVLLKGIPEEIVAMETKLLALTERMLPIHRLAHIAFNNPELALKYYEAKDSGTEPGFEIQDPYRTTVADGELQQAAKAFELPVASTEEQAPNPLAPNVQLGGIAGAAGRLTRAIERKASVGGPQNSRTVLRDVAGHTLVVGDITPRDWVARVDQNLTKEQITKARGWYGDLHDLMSQAFGEADAEKYALAWLLSQQNTSPSGGMLNVLRAADEVRGLSQVKIAGLNASNLKKVLRGELPTEGYGSKLLDFIDSELQRKTRTTMGDDVRGGAPAVIDVWANRDVGKIDERMLKHISEVYGPKAAAKLKVDGEGIGETDYEYGSRFYNGLTKTLNALGYDGGGWVAAEVQAVGWMAMQTELGANPEFPSDIFDKNTRRISVGLAPGAGTGLQGMGEIRPEEAMRLVVKIAEATGVKIRSVLTAGGAYLGEREGALQIDILGSPEAFQDFAAALGMALKQTEVLVSRPLASGKSRGYTIVEESGGILGSKDDAERFVSRVRELVAEQQKAAAGEKKFEPWTIGSGYQMIMVDGKPALRFLHGIWDDTVGRVSWKGNWNVKEREAFEAAIATASTEFRIGARKHIDHFEVLSEHNDWAKQPDGQAYRDSLLSRGRTGIATRLSSDPELRLLPDAFGPPPGQVAPLLQESLDKLAVLEKTRAATHVAGLPYQSFPGLSPELRAAEIKFAEILSGFDAFPKYATLDNTQYGKILDVDLVRRLLPEYALDEIKYLTATHGPAGVWIQQQFERLLATPAGPDSKIVMLAGGPGSGKSTFIDGALATTIAESDLVLDGVMGKFDKAVARIDMALKSGRFVRIAYIYLDVETAAARSVGRRADPETFELKGREVPPFHLADDHVRAQQTIARLAEHYKNEIAEGSMIIEVGDNSESPKTFISIDKFVTESYTIGDETTEQTVARVQAKVEEVIDSEKARFAEKAREAAVGTGQAVQGVVGQAVEGGDGGPGRAGQEGAAAKPLSQGGKIVRGAFYPSTNTLALFEEHNQTTFIHEMSHSWVQHAMVFAGSGKADAEYLEKIWNPLVSYLGIQPGQTALTKDQQEKWARTNEAYFMEGVSPSSELKRTLRAVKAWFLEIYKNLAGLESDAGIKIELTPAVRALMDRVYATDEQIAAATKEVGYEPEAIPGLDPKAAAEIRDLQIKSRSIAEEILLKDALANQLALRDSTIAAELAKNTAEVTAAVSADPLVVAMDDIQERLGKGSIPAEWAHRFKENKLSPAQLTEFIVAAELAGMSGDELAEAFIASKTKGQMISDGIKARMDAFERPDRAMLREKALEAIHSDQSAELLALERQILGDLLANKAVKEEVATRRREEARIEAAAIRVQAKALLAKKDIRDASAFRVYYTAERNAAVRVSRALQKKDIAAAVEAKKQQLLNHILASESIKIRAEVAKAQRFLAPFENRSDFMGMPYGFVRQIDKLLIDRGMSERNPQDEITMLAIAKDMAARGDDLGNISNMTGLTLDKNGNWIPESLSDLVVRINEDYHAITLPDSVFLQTPSQLENMKIEELRDLRDTIKLLNEIGRKHERFLSAFITADMKTAAKELRASIELLVGKPHADERKLGTKYSSSLAKAVESISNLPDSATPLLVNLLTLVTFLDGGQNDGPAHRIFYRILKDAENAKTSIMEKTMEKVNAIFEKHYSPKEIAAYKEKQYQFDFLVNDDGSKRYISREGILAVLLNWGNEGNRDRIRTGFGQQVGDQFVPMSDENINEMLDVLDKKDFDFAQDIWNHLQTYWPDIVKLEMMAKGVQPTAVTPSTVTSKFGEYAGGYYPIAYDFEKSAQAATNADERNALFKRFSTAAAHTDRGHAEARVAGGVKRPVRLSMDVLFNHLENVVHDLAFRPAVIDMNRILKMSDVKLALQNALGIDGIRTIENSLKSVASDQGEHNGFWDSQIKSFRSSFTTAVLGLRLIRLIPDVAVNLSTVIWEIGPQRAAQAIRDFAFNPVEGKTFVDSKSPMMRNRSKFMERDIYDISRKWDGRSSAIQQYAFVIQALADQALSYPMWLEVYNHSLAEKGERVAAQIADETMVKTFGNGSELDRVGVQRGGEKQKIMSMFYSWNSMMFNRMWLEGKLGGLAYNEGNTSQVISHAARAAFLGILLPAVIESFLIEALRNTRGDDKEARKRRIMSRILQQPFGYVWLLRDVASYAIEKAVTGRATYRMSPIESALETLIGPAVDATTIAFTKGKHFDQKFAEKSARGVSAFVGSPQLFNDVFFNYVDWMKGRGEWTWKDFIGRRKKK